MTESSIYVNRTSVGVPSDPVSGTFTGEAWRDVIVPRRDGINVADVFFTPCARTDWHTHEGGQLLIVRSGEGYIGDEHGAHRVAAGDTVWTPPGIRHWHGAAPDRTFLHTAVSIRGVEWSDPVTDGEYARWTAPDGN
ncbi:cupin domain-containing protein [Microbacterium invictum]|uniref:Quercetin dioxygenase-like cupin family protein n=1 Tax=Microbacterium invictum TaxID=515415 RepID=A0AA40SRU3_9MICO|nr:MULTISPECIES: cupin domain-containing protein [Microbacterium]MBB4141260.1 quercetin dioxygenase-like cupin family protein [Microbacterium invictum]